MMRSLPILFCSASGLIIGLTTMSPALSDEVKDGSLAVEDSISAQATGKYQVCGYKQSTTASTRSGRLTGAKASRRSNKSKPSKVRNLKAPSKKITKKKAKLVWKKPKRSGSTRISKYQFRLKVNNKKWSKWTAKPTKKLATNKKKTSFAKKYKKLKAGTTYFFQVRAKNANGKGAKDRVGFTTLSNCSPVGPGGNPVAPGGNPVGPGGNPVDPGGNPVKPLRSISYTYNNTSTGAWGNEAGTLQKVQSTQFVDGIPSILTVQTPSDDRCISIFDQFDNKPFATAGSGDPISVSPPSGSNPQQLTIIPWQSSNGGCNINTDFEKYDASIVIAVFVSKTYYDSPPKNATVCKISVTDAAEIDDMALRGKGGDTWTEGDCIIDRPQERGSKYTGSLFTMASDGKSKPLFIELDDDVVLKTPLNAMVSSTRKGADPCVITTRRPIIVTGFGRLDTSVTTADYPGNKSQQNGKYKVDTGQLIVNSSAPDDFSIDVSGVTISNSPSRNDSAVKLNTVRSCDGTATNRSVKVFDVKRVVWNGASDAYEVGEGSLVGNSWILSADDAIKVSAKSQRFQDITVLQGNSGGVVNIGSYGYNYGTAGSSVDGVYVPRIIQGGSDGTRIPNPANGNGGATGVIQTLTCPIKNLNGDNQNVTDVTINDFTIAGLAGDLAGGKGVNTYNRPFSLGVQDTAFCNGDVSDTVTFGNFEFTNFDFFGEPRLNSNLYVSTPNYATARIKLEPIRFCAGPNQGAVCAEPPPGPNSSTNRPVTFWPDGTKSQGNYVCGTTLASNCYTVNGTAPVASGGVTNVDYQVDYSRDQGIWQNKVGFPYF